MKNINATISTKVITYIILFWDVDFNSHVQFKNFNEESLGATTAHLMLRKTVILTKKSNILKFCL